MSINLQIDHPPIEGTWWDPSNPSIQWHGTIVFEAGKRATLRLVEYGKFFLKEGSNQLSAIRKFLHGYTKNGESITLSKCFSISSSQSFGSQETHFDVQQVILGGHFLENDLTFDAIQVEFDYLDDWITYSRFEAKNMTDQKDQKEIRIRLNQDHQFPFQAPDYSKSLFYIGYQTNHSAFKFSIKSCVNLQITYRERQSLDSMLKDIHQWAWFFTLATAHKSQLAALSVFREDLRFNIGNKSVKTPYEVWLPSSRERGKLKRLHPPEMTFTLPDIQNDLSNIIARWKAIQVPWAAVLHRYFGSIHREGIQLQEQFLSRTQAIEALHRAEEGSTTVKQIAAYGAVWEKAPPSLKKKLGEKNAFIEAVRINRNYWTHYNPKDEEKALDFTSLFDLTQKLGFLLEAAILKEIGLPTSIIESAIAPRRWGRLVQFDDAD